MFHSPGRSNCFEPKIARVFSRIRVRIQFLMHLLFSSQYKAQHNIIIQPKLSTDMHPALACTLINGKTL